MCRRPGQQYAKGKAEHGAEPKYLRPHDRHQQKPSLAARANPGMAGDPASVEKCNRRTIAMSAGAAADRTERAKGTMPVPNN